MGARQKILGLGIVGLLAGCAGSPPPATTHAQTVVQATTPDPQPTESNPPGDIPDNTVFVAYRHPGQPYQLKVPEGWARTDLPTGASFTDKLNTVRVEAAQAAAAPTEASVKTQVKGEIRKVGMVSRQGGKAIRVVYRADSQPDPVTGKVVRDEIERYVFYRNGHEVVLTLSGPVGADNVDPWRTVSDSFRWTS
ncbi:hypothetical protein ACIBHX_23870 [Nonomuraea sp. NPDC050536]|uniref:hypothetical protein n=1 Tax=Nonomuraea sp. NPDC050536 TaxID=3364366 RepID=UPI0037CA0A53